MANLIELQAAAEMLGLSPAELTDMRSRGEISGYRDGNTWKFKEAELERVAQQKGITLGAAGPPAEEESDELIDLHLEDSADVTDEVEGVGSDSILVSEEELGQSDENTASTIIGEVEDLAAADEEGGSELRLSDDDEVTGLSSDVLGGEGDQSVSASDTANLKLAASSAIGDEMSLEDSGSLNLSLDEDEAGSELKLGESKASSSGFGSAIDLDLDDAELVLGSGTGSDVTSGAGDSGINLANPSDSGLSLEEPLDLNAGSAADALELGEDDLISVDEAEAGGQADDDFLLTPVDGAIEEESDSGSQVIALDSEEFDDSAATMLTEEEEAPALEEETVEFAAVEEESPVAAAAPALAGAPMAAEEAPYTIWNVLSLFGILLFLGFTGILMLDLVNNIWSWESNYEFSSSIMEAILKMMPG